MQVLFSNFQQLDLEEAQALAASPETTAYELVQALLFTGSYRVSGATVAADSPADGAVNVEPGVFTMAGGLFYSLSTIATMNILTGAPNPSANIWGTGEAADSTNPRLDIICVTYQKIPNTPEVKTFINNTVNPPVQYTQTTNTVNESAPLFSVVHGTPSATPSAPPVPAGYMLLATILVPANATTIGPSDVTNNVSINIKTLEQLQFGTQAQSAFSDLLHGVGVYSGYQGSMAVSQTAVPSLAVSIAEGAALEGGVTATVASQTTVPITAPSFTHVPSEAVSFSSGNTQTLQTNGTPPHQIRPGSVVVPGFVENTDFSINYTGGAITRLTGGSIPSGGAIVIQYDYYLPRIDLIQITFGTNLLSAVVGIPGQIPVAPIISANSLALAQILVGEGISAIVTANITDKRIYLSSVQEVVDAHTSPESGVNPTLEARLNAHELRAITSVETVHGIKQGAGNGFIADQVDGFDASAIPVANAILPLNSNGLFPAAVVTQGPGSGFNADEVDGFHASSTPAANTILPLNGSGLFPAAVVTQGSGSGLNADQVDGFNASSTPTPGALLPLNGSGKFPSSVIALPFGNALKSNLKVSSDATTPNSKMDITADLLSVQGVVATNFSLVLNMQTNGANGLDVGVVAANSWYAVFVITDPTGASVASFSSLSSTAPNMTGLTPYTNFRRVGWIRTDGSGNILQSARVGGIVMYMSAVYTAPTGVGASMAARVPPTSRMAKFSMVGQSSAGAACTVTMTTPGAANTTEVFFCGAPPNPNSGFGSSSVDFLTDASQNVSIAVSGSVTTFITGYYDEV